MLTIRPVKKLHNHWRGPDLLDVPSSADGLGDLFAKAVYFDRRKLILGIFGNSMLPVVLPLTQQQPMMENLRKMLPAVLRAIKVAPHSIVKEQAALSIFRVAKTNSRVCLGVLNEFERMLSFFFEDGGTALEDAILELTDIPTKPIQMDSPAERTRKILIARDNLLSIAPKREDA